MLWYLLWYWWVSLFFVLVLVGILVIDLLIMGVFWDDIVVVEVRLILEIVVIDIIVFIVIDFV